MFGPQILARTLSIPAVKDSYGNTWQYNSRSDRHSKIACWGVFFDLLNNCHHLLQHAAAGKIGFGINHELHDFKADRKKNLDLVVCTPGSLTTATHTDFAGLADLYGIELNTSERKALNALPKVARVPVGTVRIALEAKAAMTAHIKALPRLHDELNSSHSAIHGSFEQAIAAAFTMVNMADEFMSSDMNKFSIAENTPKYNQHTQPKDTTRTIEKIKKIPRRTKEGDYGFDAIGIVLISMKNDGSPAVIVEKDPAPKPNDIFHYESMIRRASELYSSKYGSQ